MAKKLKCYKIVTTWGWEPLQLFSFLASRHALSHTSHLQTIDPIWSLFRVRFLVLKQLFWSHLWLHQSLHCFRGGGEGVRCSLKNEVNIIKITFRHSDCQVRAGGRKGGSDQSERVSRQPGPIRIRRWGTIHTWGGLVLYSRRVGVGLDLSNHSPMLRLKNWVSHLYMASSKYNPNYPWW